MLTFLSKLVLYRISTSTALEAFESQPKANAHGTPKAFNLYLLRGTEENLAKLKDCLSDARLSVENFWSLSGAGTVCHSPIPMQ